MVMDTIGWFYGYPADICGDCGSKDIGRKVEELTGGEVPAGGVVVSGTHTHASVDTIAKDTEVVLRAGSRRDDRSDHRSCSE